MTISPQEGRLQQQQRGSLGSYSHSLRFRPFRSGFLPRFFLAPSSSGRSSPRCCSSFSNFSVGSWMSVQRRSARATFSLECVSIWSSRAVMRRYSASVQTRILVPRLSVQRWSRVRKAWRRGSRSSRSCSTSRSRARICRSRESACGGIMFKRWIKSSMQLIRPKPTQSDKQYSNSHSRINPAACRRPASLSVCAHPTPPPARAKPCLSSLAHLLSNFKNKRMRKYSQDLQLLSELETDQLDIAKLREQRQLVARVQSSLLKKDQEIAQLRSLLEKYQQYQQKYTSLKVELTERAHLMAKKENECKLLRRQMEELMQEQADHQAKIKQYESERQSALRDRHQMENAHKQIELTFKEYQAQFRKRENELAFDLERAYQQIKEANSRIDELELVAEEKRLLQEKLREAEKLRTEERQKTPKRRESTSKQKTDPDTQTLLEEIDRLKNELLAKEEQLASNRVLNYELTLEYDSSINGICALQTELSNYRKENNELKKILSLLREQEKCREIEQKYTLRHQTRMDTPESQEEVSGMEDDLPTHKFHSNDALTIQS